MASRHLPEKHNPLMINDIPEYAELVARRRLGQTKLTPKMVAATSVIDPSSLGVFDYAHLRAPLPRGIHSGIFHRSPNSYFLMRRSEDGYVSATGMFKATFPYAEAKEEDAERRYIKSLPTTSVDETAGNVWIPPEQAMTLAEEYQIVPWIRALLDPAQIAITSTPDSPPKDIRAPPKFNFTAEGQSSLLPITPSSMPRSTRSRRSASPNKKRNFGSPRKRSTRLAAASLETAPLVSETDASLSSTSKSEETTSTAVTEEVQIKEVVTEPPVVFAPVDEEPKVEVKVDQDVQVFNGVETTHTSVELNLPSTQLPSEEETAKMIEEAKAMVQAAAKELQPSDTSIKTKRKADDMAVDDEDENEDEDSSEEPRAKKVKVEVQLRKARVRNRALLGITATVAFGALIPYVMGVF